MSVVRQDYRSAAQATGRVQDRRSKMQIGLIGSDVCKVIFCQVFCKNVGVQNM